MMRAFGLGLILALSAPSAASAQMAPSQSPEQRAAALVARMALEEKAAQLRHAAPGVPRLGIPEYNWWSEGLHGVARAGEATVFPQAIGLAATWDVPLVHRVADTIATEFRAKYRASLLPDGGSKQYRGLTLWSPNVNIFRDPRWGRGQETWGEDPWLTSRFGVAFITGLQGQDPEHLKTLAAVKHFAVHSGPEAGRHRDDVHPSPHDLEDTYLPAFRAAVTDAHAQGLMCAYNAVDGIPACASPLLASRVRGTWGFGGHIVSDCGAIADFYSDSGHRYSASPEAGIAAALNAGTDLICGFDHDGSVDPAAVVKAVQTGLVAEATLDRALTRLFEARFRLGMLGAAGDPYAAIPASDSDTPAHAALAAEAARASIVLLKNDGLLPLRRAPRRIAVIGPNADSIDALVGNYNGTPSAPVTLVAGLRQRFPDSEIRFVEGTGLVGAPLKPVPAAALCRDEDCRKPGIRVEEFAGTALAGAPVRNATSDLIRFSWGRPTRAERQTSLRWSGYIVPQETGAYRFKLDSEGGYRIRVDGREVVNAWDAADAATIADGEVTLVAGRRYPISVEAIQSGSRGDQRLLWSSFGEREDAALAAARDADLIVFAGGLSPRLEGEEMRVHAPGFAGGDRTSLDLPPPQQKLLERLHATGKPVVLVLMNGSALGINWADAHVPAIVEAWYPGQNGGRAVADLIAGDYSPAGRLPVTFYRSADQLPAFTDYAMAGRTYRYFTGEALYPFGHGLSYTRFAYSSPVVPAKLKPGEPAEIAVTVINAGARDGDEVVQLYISRPIPGAPIRALKGFQRIHLKRGGSQVVRFRLDPEAFSVVDAQGDRTVPAGPAQLWIGGGQPNARAGLAQPAGVAARLVITD